MAEATVIYNGVQLPYVNLRIQSDPVFAEDGIQLMYYRTTFSVFGYFTSTSESNFSQLVLGVRSAFQQSMGDLQIGFTTLSGDEFNKIIHVIPPKGLNRGIGAPSSAGLTDVNFGPIPKNLQLMEMRGGLSCMYTWVVETHTKEAISFSQDNSGYVSATDNSQNISPFAVLAFIFDQTFDLDANGFQTMTMSGFVKISAASVQQGYTADYYRLSCTPPVPNNFKPEHRRFQVSKDGTTLFFNHVYQEVMYTLPQPLTSGQAIYTVRIQNNGMIASFALHGNFSAPRNVTKARIVGAISSLVQGRLGNFLNNATNPAIFENQEITTSIYDNTIAFSFTGFFGIGGEPGTKINASLYIGPNSTLLQADLNSTGISYDPGIYGSNGILSFMPYWAYDAAISAGSGSYNNQGSTQKKASSTLSPVQGQVPPTVTVQGSPLQPTAASAAHLLNPYIAYHEEYSYELDTGIAVYVPKTQGAVITQQVRSPSLRVIQAGYATNIGTSPIDAPLPPAPILLASSKGSTGGKGVVLKSRIQPQSPEPIHLGIYNKYTIRWAYVQQYNNSQIANGLTEAGIYFPGDPRRKSYKPNPQPSNLVSGQYDFQLVPKPPSS